MTKLTAALWLAGNLIWNTLIAVLITGLVACLLDAHVAGEAAAIGLADVSDAPLIWTLCLSFFAAWLVSFNGGWGDLFKHFPWEVVFFGWLITS